VPTVLGKNGMGDSTLLKTIRVFSIVSLGVV
jgi:ABC-type branched-subunit amino acid transport system ATPase component